jgi:mannose-6-phosphate isomerase
MTLIQTAASAARTWLEDAALPLWASAGVDDSGAFHERLRFDGSPDLESPRRMRVQARQLYVYSEAAVRGWWAPARDVAEVGFEAFERDCWARDGQPGLLHTFAADKSPLDLKRDTYDHAFGLFALAWYYKLTREGRVLDLARQILDVLDGRLADPMHGGFVESIPAALPRRSDPHMHLLEASLEWVEATDDPRFLDLAQRMTALFQARFFDRETGTLREFFSADLGPAAGPPGQVVAPGHHFEWSWLLAWAQRLGAGDAAREAEALYAYGVAHGLDADGFAVDECDRHGRQVRRSRRAWPQTELIEAYLNRARQGEAEAADAAGKLT